MLKKILRKFGYIHEKDIIERAVKLNNEHSGQNEKTPEELMYNTGVCDGVNTLCSSLSIGVPHFLRYIRSEKMKNGELD